LNEIRRLTPMRNDMHIPRRQERLRAIHLPQTFEITAGTLAA
jgi:hypothetical protein